MRTLDFPSFVKALSSVVKEPHATYLNRSRSYQTAHEFVDSSCESARKAWGKRAFQGDYIFTRGTGASALFIMTFWFAHVAAKFGSSLDTYVRKVYREFPVSHWHSGRGRLAVPKGAGAGRAIVNTILGQLIPPLDELPEEESSEYLERENPRLFSKLERVLSPAAWKPFEREFVDTEKTGGVYAIIGLDRGLERVKIRVGQAENLQNRLSTHLSQIQSDFPSGVAPLFYNTQGIKISDLDTAEQALFHLVPRTLRVEAAQHPGRCRFCRSGLE